MRTLFDWIRDLFWESRLPLGQGHPDEWTAGLFVGPLGVPPEPSAHDILLHVGTAEEAERMLVHLGHLGSIDVIRVYGMDDLPPPDRRQVEKAGRGLRSRGILVHWVAEASGSGGSR